MVDIRIGGVHPDLLWLLPDHRRPARRARDGRHRRVLGRAGLRPGPAHPFGLSALVGCLLGYAVGVGHRRRWTAGPPGSSRWPRSSGSVAADMLFAVLGAILGQATDGAGRTSSSLFVVVGVSSVVLVLPVSRLMRWALRRRGQPPLAGLGPGRRARRLVKRSLRHPIRGDRLHPKPSTTTARAAGRLARARRRTAAHAAAQERQRRVPGRLARGRAVPAQPAPARSSGSSCSSSSASWCCGCGPSR